MGNMSTIISMADSKPWRYDKVARVRVGYIYSTLLKQHLIDEVNRKYKEQNK